MNKYYYIAFGFIFIVSCGLKNQDQIYSTKKVETEFFVCDSIRDSVLNKVVYKHVDVYPEYVGGKLKFASDLLRGLSMSEDDFQASFSLEFIVDFDGRIIGERIKNKNTYTYTPAEKQLLKLLILLPKWKPGMCNNINVPVKIFLPIKI